MADLYTQTIVGDGVSTHTVGANARQQIVPFTRFGTRKIAFYRVGRADTNNGGLMDQESMTTILNAIQTQAEIVMVGAPYVSNNWGKFMIAVYEDTANDGSNTDDGANANAKSLEEVVREVTGDGNAQVARYFMFGAPETGTDDYYGWSDNYTYQEYATKAEFLANSYTQ